VLRLAERYGGDLDHFDVWVLFPGAEEGLVLGMARVAQAAIAATSIPPRTVFLKRRQGGHRDRAPTRPARASCSRTPITRRSSSCARQIAEEDAEGKKQGTALARWCRAGASDANGRNARAGFRPSPSPA